VAIIVTISLPARIGATYAQSSILHPEPSPCCGRSMVSSVIGFVGNEAVAVFRIRIGRQIGLCRSSSRLLPRTHRRMTSLGVLVGRIAVWAGYPLADPVVGLLISPRSSCPLAVSGSILLGRLDGVEPKRFRRSCTPPATCRGPEVTDVALGGSVTGCTQP